MLQDRKRYVCSRVRASFNPEMLQAWEVKGLKSYPQIKLKVLQSGTNLIPYSNSQYASSINSFKAVLKTELFRQLNMECFIGGVWIGTLTLLLVCVCVRACVRACERASVRACVRASESACERACVRACVCVCVHARARSSVRAWREGGWVSNPCSTDPI